MAKIELIPRLKLVQIDQAENVEPKTLVIFLYFHTLSKQIFNAIQRIESCKPPFKNTDLIAIDAQKKSCFPIQINQSISKIIIVYGSNNAVFISETRLIISEFLALGFTLDQIYLILTNQDKKIKAVLKAIQTQKKSLSTLNIANYQLYHELKLQKGIHDGTNHLYNLIKQALMR